MEHHPITWHSLIPGINAIPGHTFHALFAMVILIAWAWRANHQLAAARAAGTHLVPDSRLSARNLAEIFVGAMKSMVDGVLADRGRPYIALFGSFFIFILIANLLGLLPGFSPPTSNFNITFAMGVASFIGFNVIGIRTQGIVNYAKHFVGPVWWLGVLMVPLELIDNAVRPVSLGLRLFGNMTGDHLVLEIFTDLTKLVIPVIFYFLGAFVSLIQAFVFTLLSIIYVSLAMGHGDHDDHGHGHGNAHGDAHMAPAHH
ncbi:MAG TPA: F0F1 ATP synthase subunit A [Candidatus Limnocylindrales bacterium]|nr:F0F1 ATP synthase subunit A [Candidatus Limnocylindrales bacterium]